MPIVKLALNAVQHKTRYFLPGEVNPLQLQDDYFTIAANQELNENVLTNDIHPEATTFAGIVKVNGSGALVEASVAGSDGGEFYFYANGSVNFYPHGDFNALVADETVVTSATYTYQVDNWQATATVFVEVTAAVIPKDALWNNVELLLQYPEGSSDLVDRTGKHTINRQGSADWTWDSTYNSAISFPTTPLSQIGIGDPGDFSFLLDAETDWTIDGWFRPAALSGKRILGMTVDSATGSGLLLVYNNPTINYSIFKQGQVLFSGNMYGMAVSNTWCHWVFALDKASKIFYWMSNGYLLSNHFNSDAVFSATNVGRLILGGRDATPASTFSGRMTAVRITKGLRWPEANYEIPYPPYPEVAP